MKDQIDELEVKIYPKYKKPTTGKPESDPSYSPCCKQNNWIEFDGGYQCHFCDFCQ